MGVSFTIKIKEIVESYPADLKKEQVALYLVELKAREFDNELADNELIITADTIVCLGEKILGKPKDEKEAFKMLNELSGKEHEVITAVYLKTKQKTHSFYDSTSVYFRGISEQSITEYIKNYQPFDKAGAYGIQENREEGKNINRFIEKINGSYSNVVGFPIEKLREKLVAF